MKARPSKGDQTKELILNETKRLFAAHGYHGTGIEAISEASKIKRGGLYYHIGNKQQLLYDVLLRATEWIIERARVVLKSDQSPPEKLRALCRMHMLSVSENMAEYRILMRDFDNLEPKHRKHINGLRKEYEEAWMTVLEDGTKEGYVRKLDPIGPKGVLGQFNFAFMWWNPDGPMSADEAGDIFFDVLIRGLRAEDT